MKKLIYYLAFITLLSPGICLTQTVKELINKLEEAHECGNYKEQINIVSQLIKRAGEDSLRYVLIGARGNLYAQINETEKSIEDFKYAVKIFPKRPEAYFALGIIYKNLGDFDSAVFYFNKVIRINPAYNNVYKFRGKVYFSLANYKRAITDFNKALEYEHDAEIYCDRGLCYVFQFDFEKAVSDFTKSVDLEPDNADAYILRALSYSGLKDNEKEIADYTKYIELKPDNFYTYRYRGMTYYNLQEYSKAIEDFSRAIELITKEIQTEKSGQDNYDTDTTLSDKNVVLDNQDTTGSPAKVTKSKNASYIKGKTVINTEEILKELLLYRATCYTKLSNYVKARTDYMQIYGIYPDRSISMDLLGWNYIISDMYDSAILYFRKALVMDSLNKDILIGLALAYFCNEEYDSSKDILNVLIDLVPELNRGIDGLKKLEEEFWYTDSDKEKIKAMLEFYGY